MTEITFNREKYVKSVTTDNSQGVMDGFKLN